MHHELQYMSSPRRGHSGAADAMCNFESKMRRRRSGNQICLRVGAALVAVGRNDKIAIRVQVRSRKPIAAIRWLCDLAHE